MRKLKSDAPGVPGEDILSPPNRIKARRWKYGICWKAKPKEDREKGVQYVFCHGDLGQHNLIVNQGTQKIKVIIDWKFGGFYPEWFEKPYWERRGPSCALEGEEDDIERCRKWLWENCEEVVMAPLQSMVNLTSMSPSRFQELQLFLLLLSCLVSILMN